MAAFTSLLSTDTETACGTSVAEAREALAYWRGRLARLPWHRRAARAEAREMAARWQQRLVTAHLERWRLSALTGLVAVLANAHTTRLNAFRNSTCNCARRRAVA